MSADPVVRLCVLFVPGHRPERFAKAAATRADQIAIDLEDAVPMPLKTESRSATIAWLGEQETALVRRWGVRINHPDSEAGRADIDALAAAPQRPGFVMIPKVESASAVADLAVALPGVALIPMIESPAALLACLAIARASPAVSALLFGGYDYAVAAGFRPGTAGWHYPRAHLATVAAAVGIQSIDVPCVDLKDPAVLARELTEARELGFTAKAAIHPDQVDRIRAAFAPQEDELAWAQQVIAASAAAEGGVAVVDGRMIDRPVELAAQRAVAIAAAVS
jgi:citrate lyase beta subunit